MSINTFLERLVAHRWIAGPSIEDAIARAKLFNSRNISAIINYLGELLVDKSNVENKVRIYKELIDKIKANRVKADITLKATAFGFLIDPKYLQTNYHKIVDYAKKNNLFAWLDMEEPKYVDTTIGVYKGTIRSGNVGIALQANLQRSYQDLKDLVSRGAVIRLVKGAYKSDMAFRSRKSVTSNYINLMNYLFLHSKSFTIATHDHNIINRAIKLNEKYKRNVTYAMLNGIRNRYALALARSGKKVALYVPFGTDWIGYSYRRLKGAGHVSLVLRSMLESQEI